AHTNGWTSRPDHGAAYGARGVRRASDYGGDAGGGAAHSKHERRSRGAGLAPGAARSGGGREPYRERERGPGRPRHRVGRRTGPGGCRGRAGGRSVRHVGRMPAARSLAAALVPLRPYVRRAGQALLDLLLPEPPPCPACRRPKEPDEPGICPNCLERMPLLVPPLCWRCGQPLRGEAAQAELCRLCRQEGRFFAFARAPAVYDGAVKDWIHRFKYGGERELGEALGVLMGRFLERERVLWPLDAVVPVPLHPSRLQ